MKSLTELCYEKLANDIYNMPPQLKEQLQLETTKIIKERIRKKYIKKLEEDIKKQIVENMSENIPCILNQMISQNTSDPNMLTLDYEITNDVIDISILIFDSIRNQLSVSSYLGDYDFNMYKNYDSGGDY